MSLPLVIAILFVIAAGGWATGRAIRVLLAPTRGVVTADLWGIIACVYIVWAPAYFVFLALLRWHVAGLPPGNFLAMSGSIESMADAEALLLGFLLCVPVWDFVQRPAWRVSRLFWGTLAPMWAEVWPPSRRDPGLIAAVVLCPLGTVLIAGVVYQQMNSFFRCEAAGIVVSRPGMLAGGVKDYPYDSVTGLRQEWFKGDGGRQRPMWVVRFADGVEWHCQDEAVGPRLFDDLQRRTGVRPVISPKPPR
jgi:hypothetical protein